MPYIYLQCNYAVDRIDLYEDSVVYPRGTCTNKTTYTQHEVSSTSSTFYVILHPASGYTSPFINNGLGNQPIYASYDGTYGWLASFTWEWAYAAGPSRPIVIAGGLSASSGHYMIYFGEGISYVECLYYNTSGYYTSRTLFSSGSVSSAECYPNTPFLVSTVQCYTGYSNIEYSLNGSNYQSWPGGFQYFTPFSIWLRATREKPSEQIPTFYWKSSTMMLNILRLVKIILYKQQLQRRHGIDYKMLLLK